MNLLEGQNTVAMLLKTEQFRKLKRRPSRPKLHVGELKTMQSIREDFIFFGFKEEEIGIRTWTKLLRKGKPRSCKADLDEMERNYAKELAEEALAFEYLLRCKLEFGTIDPKVIARKKMTQPTSK